MFQGLINNAKSAVSGVVLKYVARASVAVPFVIALGFALAAITVMLLDRFGQVGVIAAIFVSVKEREEEAAEQVAKNNRHRGGRQ